MKAWVLQDIGNIRLKTLEEPALADHEVLVAVKAAGICGSDIPRIYQTGAYAYPLIPGHEFSGLVVGTGADTDTVWQGKKVGIFPLIPCRSCLPCQKRQYEMCRNYSYLGSRRNGGFAEYVAVPSNNLIQIPESVSFEEAAVLEPLSVAVHAMRRTAIQTSDTAVVCGLGAIGLFLTMFLRDAGIKNILVIGNKECQKRTVLELGLSEDSYCDSRLQEAGQWIMEHTDGYGADVFFECVGKNETYVQAVDNTAPGGKICLLGNPYTDMGLERKVYWKILRKQLTVMGTWNSSFTESPEDDWHYVLDRLSKKRISPAGMISHRFTLEELGCGFRIMRDKTEEYVKIVGIYD